MRTAALIACVLAASCASRDGRNEREGSDGEGPERASPARIEADVRKLASFGTRHTLSATDDPVRMYLMQMGQIPLLNRAQEIASAKQIEKTRCR